MFYHREKRHFREKRGSVSKRLAHFERVLDGNRRILRKKMQSTLVETQETSKEEELPKLKQKTDARA